MPSTIKISFFKKSLIKEVALISTGNWLMEGRRIREDTQVTQWKSIKSTWAIGWGVGKDKF